MADSVLTTAAVVTCPHNFPIAFAPTGVLKVGGAAVVRTSDLTTAVLSCTNQSKCTTVMTSSPSTALKDGDAVVLATGLKTDIGSVQVSGGQTLLKAG